MMQPFRTFSIWALQFLHHNPSLVGSDYCHVSTNRIVLTWSEVQVSSYRVKYRILHYSLDHCNENFNFLILICLTGMGSAE